jgi:hypothetical protein
MLCEVAVQTALDLAFAVAESLVFWNQRRLADNDRDAFGICPLVKYSSLITNRTDRTAVAPVHRFREHFVSRR